MDLVFSLCKHRLHSQDKDQFLKTIKWMMETQILEDEIKEVSELNSILLAQK
jgi:hypothetical protein